MRSLVLSLFVVLFVLGNFSFAQCQGGRCGAKRQFRTPVRSYFSQVKPIRHALMLSK